jgi:hypothetical protein
VKLSLKNMLPFFEYKKSDNKYLKIFGKMMLTRIWAWMAQLDKFDKKNASDIEDDLEIVGIFPSGENNVNVSVTTDRVYNYAFARCIPFMKDRANMFISSLYEKQVDDIVRINTDGFIMKKPLKNIHLRKDIGELKKEEKYCGDLHIVHVNKIHKINMCDKNCN